MEPSQAVAPPTTGAAHPTAAGADPVKVSGRRFGAFLIDWVVLMGIVPIAIFFAVSRPTIYTDDPSCAYLEVRDLVPSGNVCIADSSEGTWVLPTSGYIAAAIYLVVFLVAIEWILQAATGMTIGKLLFGIRTVNATGTGPGLGKQLIRGVIAIVDISWCVLIGALSILITKRNQRLGDLAAGTFVVRSSARGAPVPGAPTGVTAPGPGLDPGGVVPGGFPTAPPTEAGSPPPNPPVAAPVPAAMVPPQDMTTVYTPAAEPTTMQPAFTAAADGDPTVADGVPVAPEPEPAAADSGWTQPASDAASATSGGPQWDPARNAYIQWDPNQGTWLVYDDAAAAWKPIS